MKPIESHKDPRITNISFDNFTGSICIITPLSDNDEDDDDQIEDSMLSASQTNGGADLFNRSKHVTLITQPLLTTRLRKKNGNDSVINSRRSSFNETVSLTSSNRIEKRTSHTESIDSGLDFSLSTNSSIQNYQQQQQQQLPIHRRLSALNEDSNIDETNIERRYSKENLASKEQEETSKKPIDIPSIQQPPPLIDLTNLVSKPKKSSQKATKLNIIVEPSISLSSSTRLSVHDESMQRQPTKSKAITILGHYPNPEQMRAHINRSVLERQHPAYLSRKDVHQQSNPFDNSPVLPSKGNQTRFRKQKQLHGNNQLETAYLPTTYRNKKSLVGLANEETLEIKRKDKKQGVYHKNDPRKSLKPEVRYESLESFVTSTPRYHQSEYEQTLDTNFKKPNIIRRPIPPVFNPKTKIRPQNVPIIPPQSQSRNFSRPPTQRNQPLTINTNHRLEYNRIFPRRSQQFDAYETSSSSSTTPLRFIDEKFPQIHQQSQTIADQELLDGRFVIPSQHSRTNSPYQTSNQTYPFTSISRLKIANDSRSSASSRPNRFFVPLEQVTTTMENTDLSTNYDSDDGWSNDSAELIYVDERYRTQKKKNVHSSSQQQQPNRLLQ